MSSSELGKHDAPPSVFSNDIWLGDNSGASSLFARQVEIRGWTSVGDKLGGAYIGQWSIWSNISGDPVAPVTIPCRNLLLADCVCSVRMCRPD
jgi:hypothetical protein